VLYLAIMGILFASIALHTANNPALNSPFG